MKALFVVNQLHADAEMPETIGAVRDRAFGIVRCGRGRLARVGQKFGGHNKGLWMSRARMGIVHRWFVQRAGDADVDMGTSPAV
jgi:hypothetical protein